MARRFRNAAGPEIRRARMARELSQDQLAGQVSLQGLENVDRVVVAKIESQIRTLADHELAVFARVLGVDIKDLLPTWDNLKKDLPDLQKGHRSS